MAYTGSQAFTPPVGTLFNLNTGTVTTPIWTSIAEISKITPAGRKFGVEKTTNLSSAVEEKLSTLMDSGTVEVEYNYLEDATQVDLEAAFAAGGVHMFEIVLPGLPHTTGSGTETMTFSGIIVEKNPDGFERDKVAKGKVKIDVTGVYTFTIT